MYRRLVDAVLGPYSRAATLALVTRMRARLPRELRDMVYQQLWRDGTHIARLYKVHRLMQVPQCTQRPCRCLKAEQLPTIIDVAFVGADVALEVVEALYSCGASDYTPITSLFRATCLEEITYLVCTDAFHVGLDPASVLRVLAVDVVVENYHLETQQAPWIDHQAVALQLAPLLKIVHKSGFQLDIILSQRYIRLNVLEEFLNAIRPVLEPLQEGGAIVRFMFSYRYRDEFSSPVDYSLFDAFANPAGNWKEEMTGWLDLVSLMAGYDSPVYGLLTMNAARRYFGSPSRVRRRKRAVLPTGT
jgi:hypothetical protein